MDEDRIGLVLARVSELRSKVTNCLQKALTNGDKEEGEGQPEGSKAGPGAEEDVDNEEETESLLNIRVALESLEAQLSSLQALQQQQWYEKEAALAEIRFSQKKLLEKLKEYKGEHLEVIHEAITFAGETVEENNDLLLPPYPSRPSHSVVSGNECVSQFPYARKIAQNGVIGGGSKNELAKGIHESDRHKSQPEPRGPLCRVKVLVGAVAKAAITVIGVISVLNLAGYEPRLRKKENHKFFGLFQQQENHEGGITVECPPGKVPVIENGEIRCLVKERVEIPFDSLVATPNVMYGCG